MNNLETGATKTPELKMIHLIGKNPIHAFTRDNHFQKELQNVLNINSAGHLKQASFTKMVLKQTDCRILSRVESRVLFEILEGEYYCEAIKHTTYYI